MRLPALILVFLPLSIWAQDTSLNFSVQLLSLQSTYSPSSHYDKGRHVIGYQGQFAFSRYSTSSLFLNQQSDIGYSTRYKNHSFAFYLQAYSDEFTRNQNLQLHYAYTFKLKTNILGKNLAIIPGIGYSYHRERMDFSKLRFPDQIASGSGFIIPTSELPPSENIYYSALQGSALLRSENFFLQLQIENFNEPLISYYPNDVPDTGEGSTYLPIIYSLNNAIKLKRYRSFDFWITGCSVHSQDFIMRYAGLGAITSFKEKYILSYTIYLNQSSEISLGYYTQSIRSFIRYQNSPDSFLTYFEFGKYSLGIAYAIGKQ